MNQLKMDIQQAISALSSRGWSQRRIARELGIDRETVARYRRLAREAGAPKPAIPPPGSEAVGGEESGVAAAGSEVAPEANPAISPAGSETTTSSTGDPNPAI